MDSLRTFHPEWNQYVLLVDEVRGDFDPQKEAFKIVEATSLPLPDMKKFLFRYTILELNTAVKPYMFEWLFEKEKHDQVIYLDPDIYVYRPMTEVVDALNAGHLMVGTPHLTGQLNDDKKPSELDILNCGSFNLGFIALGKHTNLLPFIKWWKRKLEFDCAVDIQRGIFVDQKWVDLVPGMFGGCYVLRHEGYNVAYWNLGHRKVTKKDTVFFANNDPLVFFHFSGLNPKDPESLSKHQDRFELKHLGDGAQLVREYCERLICNGLETCIQWKYSFGKFSDGTDVVDFIRRYYRQNMELQEVVGDDPYKMDYRYFNSPWYSGGKDEPLVTILMRSIWESRPDLQEHFPDIQGKHRYSFAYWFLNSGVNEHKIPDVFVDLVRVSLNKCTPTPLTTVGRGIVRAAYWLDPIVKHIPSSLRDRVKEKVFTRSSPLVVSQIIQPVHELAPGVNYSGFYDQEEFAGSPRSVWMGECASVRLPTSENGIIKIVGEYDPQSHSSAHGSPDTSVEMFLNGMYVGSFVLSQPGLFERVMDIPATTTGGSRVLSFKSSHCFVPSKIGTHVDGRALSLKFSILSFNGKMVLDFDRADAPYLPDDEFGHQVGINLVGYARSEHGLGESLRLAALAVEVAQLPFCICDFTVGNSSRTLDDRWAHKFTDKNVHSVNLFHINADQMGVAHSVLGDAFFRDRHNIGYWAWELPEFPDRWLSAFAYLNEVWAPSQFVVESITRKSSVPVIRMPHSIRFSVNHSLTRSQMGLPEDRFIFLTMYDMHSYQVRKNPEAVIEAFRRAFPDPKNVTLVVKTQSVDLHPTEYEELKKRIGGVPGIMLLDRTMHRQEVYDLENLCDCFVSLHRAEGFGIALAESMYLGKSVIGTNWSGNVDFMNYKNSCPVDYQLVDLERDYGPYKRGQYWAEPDVEHAAWYMKTLVDDPHWGGRIAAEGQYTIRRDFSPEAVGQMYRKRLRVISRW